MGTPFLGCAIQYFLVWKWMVQNAYEWSGNGIVDSLKVAAH